MFQKLTRYLFTRGLFMYRKKMRNKRTVYNCGGKIPLEKKKRKRTCIERTRVNANVETIENEKKKENLTKYFPE